MKRFYLTDAKHEKQSIGELWESIAKLTIHIVEDNSMYNGEYPKEVRDAQIHTIKNLIMAIEEHR